MSTAGLLDKLASYVPTPVALSIYRHPHIPAQPTSHRRQVAVLFSDISGFTRLTALLGQAGPTGAEELTQIINQYFTQMIQIVEQFGGQVIKFSGDAMMIVFPVQSDNAPDLAVRQASECALAMQADMVRFAYVHTSRGEASLSMKIGVAVGTIIELSIGGHRQRWEYFIAGEPLAQVAMAEHHASPGQIILSPQAWARVAPYFIGQPVGDDFMRLYQVADPLPSRLAPTPDWSQLPDHTASTAAAALECYVPEVIRARWDEQAVWLAELRRMTVMFVNISGLDYEAEHTLQQVQALLLPTQELIDQYDGSLNKVAVDDKGTVLIVLFGTPQFAREDNSARAVAFALDLQELSQAQNLPMSIGITEGAVFAGPVGGPSRREYTIVGEDANLAARLMQYAGVGNIVISQRVQDRLGQQFALESLGRISLKGLSAPLPAYRVMGRQGVANQFGGRYLFNEGPLLGRTYALNVAQRVMALAQQNELQILGVTSAPGLGKSRFVGEIAQIWLMEGGTGVGSQSISYDTQSPYQAWQEILVSLYDLALQPSPRHKLAKLAWAIDKLDDPSGQRGYWQKRLPLLTDLVGLEFGDNDFTRQLAGKLRRNNTFALIAALLFKKLEEGPLMLVLEDVHWADELSLNLIRYLAKTLANLPLLIVLTWRPDVERKVLSRLQNLPNSHTLLLEPLSPEDSLALASDLLAGHDLPPKARELIISRGQGNPLFIQGVATSILEAIDNASTQNTDALAMADLPDTVQDVLMAHVDRLPETEKFTLKVASVIGTRFRLPILMASYPMARMRPLVSTHLDKLVEVDLIRLEQPDPYLEYAFKNVATQEIIYNGLLLAQRRQLHAAVASALEATHPDEIDRLAFHYSRSTNVDKALHYLYLAAQRAHRGYANQTAIDYYSQILSLMSHPIGENATSQMLSTRYWDVLLERARLFNLTGQWDNELEDLGTLGLIAEALSDVRRRALAARQWAVLYETYGDYDSGLELIERSIELAEEAEDDQLVGACYNQKGKLLYLLGSYEAANEYLQASLLRAQKHHDKVAQADSLNNLGLVAHYQGDYEVAQYLFREAIELWREMDDQAGLGSGLRNLGQIYYELSQYSDANAVYEESLTFHRAIGDPAGEAMTQHYRGQLLRALGDYGEASMLLEEALAYHQANGDRRNEAHALSHLGLLYSRLDMHDTGLDYLERAIEIMKEVESPWVQAKALTYYGWALGDLERVNEGRIALDGALRLQHSASFLREAAKMETLAHRGRIALIRGDMTLAEACLRPVLAYIRENGTQGIEHPGIIFTTGYRTLIICNRPDEAEQTIQEGYAFVMGQAKKISDPLMRDSYVHIPEHAEIIVQVELLATG